MRHVKHLLGVAALSVFGAAAHADTLPPNWYAALSGDLTWMSHADMGGGGNAALGYQFWPSDFGDLRAEGELGYHSAGGSDGWNETHYFTYMGNLYYDFNITRASLDATHITPYVGVGLGDTTAHFGNDDSGNAFAYQFMAGLTLTPASTPNIDWSLGYRYQGSDSVDNSATGTSASLHANSLELGMRFHF